MNIPILPTISISCIVISAILVAIGRALIWKYQIHKYKSVMLWAAFFVLTFFIIYTARAILISNTAFSGPSSIKVYYTIFLAFHIILAAVGGALGLVQIILTFKDKLRIHRKIGPWTSIIWFFTAITGAAVYISLCVSYPGGETTSLLKATLGL